MKQTEVGLQIEEQGGEAGWFWIGEPCHGGYEWRSYFIEYWGA